ncbi:MAG: RES domain-containing protein [Sphingomonadales bacterium]|nr:MAG: RES domain-containing protein [Sphingomonadales bacterium]
MIALVGLGPQIGRSKLRHGNNMGHFSDLAAREAEQPLNLKGIEGRRVCSTCFGDPHLAKVVEENADANKCDYCGEAGGDVIAGPLSAVMEFMLPQIELEYASADQALPRDPETKGRMFPEDEFDTRDLLESYIELELPNDYKGRLMEDIASAMPDQDWCFVNPLGTPDDEAIGNSWDAFKTVIKHRRRFFFLQHKDQELEQGLSWGDAAYNVPDLLERIGAFARDHGLITRLKAGSRWVRVQELGEGEHGFDPRRMGPPPYAKADMPNRMSPAGVPMFYGAADLSTALAEVADTKAGFACGTFETLKDIMVLDVRTAPDVPSLFDPEKAKDRATAMFMHSFIDDFRAPIDRKLRPHVDYLPTQVVTEYFRTSVASADDEPIFGVVYASTKNGQDAIVLFAENGDVVDGAPDCEPDNEEWLRMAEYTEIDHVPDAPTPQNANGG